MANQKRAIHVEISKDEIESLYQRLLKKGVRFHAPVHDAPWEWSATVFDPDGYLVEFVQDGREKNKTKQ